MDERQIRQIIATGESQEIEFKESFSADKISRAICGFANMHGGVILLGIGRNGEIIGVTGNMDELQQKISAANQVVQPAPLISIGIVGMDDKKVAAIVVQKTSDSAYYTFHGAICVREGSTTKVLEGQSHLEFLRRRHLLSFDESYELLAKSEDIDASKVRNYLRLRGQENYLETHQLEEFLISTKLAVREGVLKVKNPAILLFGINPVRFHPQIEIKLVKFSGVEPVEIIAHILVQDDLVSMIEQCIAFVRKHSSRGIQVRLEGKRLEMYEYPFSVVREAIVNAVVHRDYFSKDSIQISMFDDRLEITNPGSLPQGLTTELFGTISVQRNPSIYRFLRDMGYVEGLGTGIPRMKNEMRKHGLDDPEFVFTESFFRVILRNRFARKKPVEGVEDLNHRQKNAISYLKRHKSIKSRTYAKINQVSIGTAVNEINELVSFGFLKKIGTYKGAYYILVSEKKVR